MFANMMVPLPLEKKKSSVSVRCHGTVAIAIDWPAGGRRSLAKTSDSVIK
ncbi:hypothetical protein OSTOST_20193 [Ostertagia ostertagi]